MKHADICYFSGTGNTLLVLKVFLEQIKRHNISFSLHPIEKTEPRTLDVRDSLVLAFPVAYQSTYPFIWRFLKRLKPGREQPVYMLDTLAGFSGGIVGPVKRLLNRKGYSPVGATEIIMPSNLRFGEFAPESVREPVADGQLKGKAFAEAMLKREVSWSYYPFFEGFFYFMFLLVRLMINPVFQRLLRFLFPKPIPEKCNNCGICERLCPVENIRMEEKPVHGRKCEICLRCVSFCPQAAIKILFNKNSHYRAVYLKTILDSQSFLS